MRWLDPIYEQAYSEATDSVLQAIETASLPLAIINDPPEDLDLEGLASVINSRLESQQRHFHSIHEIALEKMVGWNNAAEVTQTAERFLIAYTSFFLRAQIPHHCCESPLIIIVSSFDSLGWSSSSVCERGPSHLVSFSKTSV